MKHLLSALSVVALALAAPGALAQTCTDISGECNTTAAADCVDGVGEAVVVQIGGLGAEDGDDNGGTCVGVPATALFTFEKDSATELKLTIENTTCGDTSALTAAFWNMSSTVTAFTGMTVTAVAPDTVDTVWTEGYSQTSAPNDGFGFGADGFGHFDANVHNGNMTPNGGDPTEILEGETLVYKITLTGSYNLCDILSEISQPPPGEMNRNVAGRFQSCGDNGDSAFIGPCSPDAPLLAVIRSFLLTPGDGRVTVDWETSLEVDNAGFNVLRREARGGGWSYVNADFIPGQGDSVSGASYRFEDLTALNGVEYVYRVEDIDLGGRKKLHTMEAAVANPRNPAVKLQSPSYGETVRLERGLKVGFQGVQVVHGSALLQVSADPTFEGALSTRVAVRHGSNEVRLNARMIDDMLALAGEGKVLYWRLEGLSDTFRMEVE